MSPFIVWFINAAKNSCNFGPRENCRAAKLPKAVNSTRSPTIKQSTAVRRLAAWQTFGQRSQLSRHKPPRARGRQRSQYISPHSITRRATPIYLYSGPAGSCYYLLHHQFARFRSASDKDPWFLGKKVLGVRSPVATNGCVLGAAFSQGSSVP